MATKRRTQPRTKPEKPARRRSVAKSPPAASSLIEYLNECVREAVSEFAGVGRRKMLVSFGWTVNERTFALVSRQARIVVRLPDAAAQRELLALDGAEPWKFGGKSPRGWLLLPEAFHDDAEALRLWLRRAWEANQAAPAKPARKHSTAATRNAKPLKHRR